MVIIRHNKIQIWQLLSYTQVIGWNVVWVEGQMDGKTDTVWRWIFCWFKDRVYRIPNDTHFTLRRKPKEKICGTNVTEQKRFTRKFLPVPHSLLHVKTTHVFLRRYHKISWISIIDKKDLACSLTSEIHRLPTIFRIKTAVNLQARIYCLLITIYRMFLLT
jgi:hypothetical protein